MIDLSLDSLVTNSMKFTQTDDKSLFILDEAKTNSSPNPPQIGHTVTFNLSGSFIKNVHLDHINLYSFFPGVYYDFFDYSQDVSSGEWTYSLNFDVSKVTPSSTYYGTIDAIDADGNQLFSIDTNFNFVWVILRLTTNMI